MATNVEPTLDRSGAHKPCGLRVMAAVFPLHGGSHVAAAAPHINHVVDCAAGFFMTESDAQHALTQLRQIPGVLPTQAMLLGAADAAWLPFRRHMRQWSPGPDALGQSWHTDPRLAAVIGALLALPLGVLSLPLIEELSLAPALALVIGMVLAAAAAGAAMACHSRVSAQHQKFTELLRSELANGRWVVVAHNVGWKGQASMLKALCERSANWCAVSNAQRRF